MSNKILSIRVERIMRHKFNNKFINLDLDENLDKRLWEFYDKPKELPPEKRPLLVGGFLGAREFKDNMREQYQDFFR